VVQAETALTGAESGITQAQSTLDLVNLQLEKAQIHSPISGVVLSQAVEAGEMIGAGFTALTIGDLSKLTVTVYIPEDRYGQISLGDLAELSIDSYPDEIFEAEVIYISDKAEYTPRNVQTQEERQNTVYGVKLSIQGGAGILIPGMPADVILNP
jgi:multidrug resistance efflux pump